MIILFNNLRCIYIYEFILFNYHKRVKYKIHIDIIIDSNTPRCDFFYITLYLITCPVGNRLPLLRIIQLQLKNLLLLFVLSCVTHDRNESSTLEWHSLHLIFFSYFISIFLWCSILTEQGLKIKCGKLVCSVKLCFRFVWFALFCIVLHDHRPNGSSLGNAWPSIKRGWPAQRIR